MSQSAGLLKKAPENLMRPHAQGFPNNALAHLLHVHMWPGLLETNNDIMHFLRLRVLPK